MAVTARMAAASQELVQRQGTRADACADAIVAAAATRLGSGAARGSSLSTDADAVLSAAVDCLSAAKVAASPVYSLCVHRNASHKHTIAYCMSR